MNSELETKMKKYYIMGLIAALLPAFTTISVKAQTSTQTSSTTTTTVNKTRPVLLPKRKIIRKSNVSTVNSSSAASTSGSSVKVQTNTTVTK